MLALVRVKEGGTSNYAELAFVQYMEYAPPTDNLDDVLGCVTFRWATAGEIDHTSSTSTASRTGKQSAAPWFGIADISAIISAVHVIRKDYPVPPFSAEKPWWQRRFYINRFYIDPVAVDESYLTDSDEE